MEIIDENFSDIERLSQENSSNIRASANSRKRMKISNESDNLLIALLGSRGASIEMIGPSSWVALFCNFLPPNEPDFIKAWDEHPTTFKYIKFFSKTVALPRYQQAFGHTYLFSGIASEAIPPTERILRIQESLNTLISGTSFNFNMCLCNWYEPHHYIGPHSDDTRQLVVNSPIASLSWGCPRTFVLKPRKSVSSNSAYKSKQVTLNSGDLIIMGGECQSTHTHEILKIKKSEVQGNRINFTFRCFK